MHCYGGEKTRKKGSREAMRVEPKGVVGKARHQVYLKCIFIGVGGLMPVKFGEDGRNRADDQETTWRVKRSLLRRHADKNSPNPLDPPTWPSHLHALRAHQKRYCRARTPTAAAVSSVQEINERIGTDDASDSALTLGMDV